MPSNTFVQVTYAVKRWTNGTDAHILPGMFFFIEREDKEVKCGKQTISCVSIVTLGHLNQILYLAWETFVQKFANNDPTAREFHALMQRYGEREIAHFAAGVSENPRRAPDPSPSDSTRGPAAAAELQAVRSFLADARREDAASNAELQRLLDIINGNDKMYALCAGPAFIMNRFNFGGVTYNRSNDQTLDGVASLETLPFVFSLNTISSHLADVHDIFPQLAEMGVGTDLFFHLHRRPVAAATATGYAFGAFCFEPIACFSQTRPIITNSYRDMAGATQSGFLVEIGKVHINGSRIDSHITQRIASGMDPSSDLGQIRQATARLDKITINLLKFK
jgi:hypothetical protein